MNRRIRARKQGGELIALSTLLIALLSSTAFVATRATRAPDSEIDQWSTQPRLARRRGLSVLKAAVARAAEARKANSAAPELFTSEPRVIAMGSGRSIPFDAEVCPFTGAPQPSLNQLDRDGDGITDDWELKHELDRRSAEDAAEDPDGDFFTNLEEFRGGTNPRVAESRPPYAEKLRFGRRKNAPFPLVYQGHSMLANSNMVFQLNVPARGNTVFASLGEEVEGVVLQRFIGGRIGEKPRLVVTRGGREIELVRGEIAVDPESKAEVINILDRSTRIVTMGALLSLCSDEYTVTGIHADKVILEDVKTGEVFDIVSVAEEKR